MNLRTAVFEPLLHKWQGLWEERFKTVPLKKPVPQEALKVLAISVAIHFGYRGDEHMAISLLSLPHTAQPYSVLGDAQATAWDAGSPRPGAPSFASKG